MVTISGKITHGLGAAGQNLKAQMPHFIRACPELEECHLGTINLNLDCELQIDLPDFIVGPFEWSKNCPAEKFGFLKIHFEVVGPRIETDAWIYIPHLSPHRSNPYYAEILAPRVNLNGSADCKIHVRAKKVTV